MLRCFFIFLLLGMSVLGALAQSANLQGQVVDDQNEPLIGVLVRIDSSLFTQVTNEKGQFFFPHLSPNHAYSIQSSYIGFGTQKIDSLLLNNKVTKKLQIQLKTALTQEVIVLSQQQKDIQQKESINQQFFEQNTQGTFAKSLE